MKNKTIKRIYKMLKPEKRAIIVISILAIIINIGEVIKPYLIEQVIDGYISQGIWAKGAMTIGIIGAIYIGIVIIRRNNRIRNNNNYYNGRRKCNI